MEIINKWCKKPAKYWQFWLPQSGAVGGIIFGLIISIINLTILHFVL